MKRMSLAFLTLGLLSLGSFGLVFTADRSLGVIAPYSFLAAPIVALLGAGVIFSVSGFVRSGPRIREAAKVKATARGATHPRLSLGGGFILFDVKRSEDGGAA